MRTQYDRAVLSAFGDELEKLATLGTVGKYVTKGVLGGAKLLGQSTRAENVMAKGIKSMGGSRKFKRAVGGATVAAGAGLATGAAVL